MKKIATSFQAIRRHAGSLGFYAHPVPIEDYDHLGDADPALVQVVYVELYDGGGPGTGELLFSLRVEQPDLEIDEVDLCPDFALAQYGEGSLAEHFITTLTP